MLVGRGTGLIDVGSMAGTGKAAVVAHVGVQGAAMVDEGAFRESLRASVGAAMMAQTVVSGGLVAAAGKPGLVAAFSQAMPGAVIPNADDSAAVVAAPAGGVGAAREGSSVGVSAPVVPAEGGDVPAAAGATASLVRGVDAVLKIAAEPVRPVESGLVAVAVGSKELKVGAGDGVVAKKSVGKSLEKAGTSPVVEVPAAEGTAAAAAPVAIVQVQAAGLPVAVVAAHVIEDQVQAPVVEATGRGKIAKVGATGGAVKATARDTKKVEGQPRIVGKAEVEPSAGMVSPVAESGAGHVGGKDTAAVVAASGVGPVAPAGVVAGHTGVMGAAGTKVAANVEVVNTAGAQGGGAGAVQDAGVKTLAATPNLLEVGIDGGTHGWLRVRAELGQTGEVTASMVAGSAGQADTLRRELPAMSTYLAGESVGVSSLVVNAAGGAGGAQDAAMSLGAGAQGGGADGRAQQGSGTPQTAEQGSGMGAREGGVSGLEFGGAELPAAVYANGSGSWLSVRV